MPGMSVVEYPFSDLLRRPNQVTSEVETHARVVLRRRGAPDLELSRADTRRSELSQAASFARILASLLPEVPPERVPVIVASVLPWTKYLSDEGRARFVIGVPEVVQDCADLGTLAPLDTYLAEWRSTAAIYADPELRDRLSSPIGEPFGEPVPHP